jgi:hypothetical protein
VIDKDVVQVGVGVDVSDGVTEGVDDGDGVTVAVGVTVNEVLGVIVGDNEILNVGDKVNVELLDIEDVGVIVIVGE